VSGVLDQGVTNILLREGGEIGLERRQMCYKPKGATLFVTTGLSLTVQNAVLGLEINGVRNKKGVLPVVPRAAGVIMSYFRSASNPKKIGDSFALVATDGECARLCQTKDKPTCSVEHSPLGFLSAHTDNGMIGTESCLKKAGPDYDSANRHADEIGCDPTISSNPDFSSLTAGSYQVCYRGASACAYFSCWPVWHSTGIHLTVQDDVVALQLQPGRGQASGYGFVMTGLQITGVLNDWHSMSFVSLSNNAAMLVSFHLVAFDGDCATVNTASAINAQQVGPVAAGQVAEKTQFTAAIFARGVGIHSVCIRIGGGQYASSGLSLRIQETVRAMSVNGVAPNRGLLAAIPAVASSRIKYTGTRAPQIGDMMSFIPPENACADKLQNPSSLISSETNPRSGFLEYVAEDTIFGQEVILKPASIQLVMYILPLKMYKVCFRAKGTMAAAKETGFSETGLAIVLQMELVSLQINLMGNYIVSSALGRNQGVRTSLPLANGNAIQLSRNGTISFITADGDCTDISPGGDNEQFSSNFQLLHLDTQKPSHTLLKAAVDSVVGVGGAKVPGVYQVHQGVLERGRVRQKEKETFPSARACEHRRGAHTHIHRYARTRALSRLLSLPLSLLPPSPQLRSPSLPY